MSVIRGEDMKNLFYWSVCVDSCSLGAIRHFILPAVLIPKLPNLNTLPCLSPPTERGHGVHHLQFLPRRLSSRGCDGWCEGNSGRRVRLKSRQRGRAAQTLPQAHERHGEAAQGHPGAGGHGEVLREGESTKSGQL